MDSLDLNFKNQPTASVGVALLNWNGGEMTAACVDSLRAGTLVPGRIVIVDNASVDGSAQWLAEKYLDVHFIRSEINRGFAGGNNMAIHYLLDAGVNFIWVLNNDTVVEKECLRLLLEAMRQDVNVAACSGKILYENPPDRIWYAGATWRHWSLKSPHRGALEIDRGQYERLEDVGFISGCCMFVRRSAFETVGLFDEAFFAYCEDADWCLRAQRAGLRLRYVPQAVLRHKVSASMKKMYKSIGGGTTSPFSLYLLFRNRGFIVRKHAREPFQMIIATSVLLADAAYYAAGLLVLRRWAKFAALVRGLWDGVRYDLAVDKIADIRD
ncbi:MAG: glycosyltransferase family 2 protein [Patescibacteria group bacterium]